MVDKEKVLEDYLKYKALSCNERKIRDLRLYIGRFIQFNRVSLDKYDEKTLIDYLTTINKYAQDTQNDIKANVKNFIKWYFIDWSSRFRNLDKLCKTQKAESSYQPEDMISESDFEKLMSEEKSIFWKAYFVTLFYGGCRPSELFLLKWKDLDLSDKDGGIFFNIHSKKNKRTFLKYIPENASYYVKQLQNNNSEYVFINPIDNKILTRQQPYYEIKKISKKALGKEIDLYTLRHSIATLNYNKEGIKDDIVAQQMGHTKSMKNTYVHNDKNKLKSNAKKIYVGELPPEKKIELEEQIKQQKKEILDLKTKMKNVYDKLDIIGNNLLENAKTHKKI